MVFKSASLESLTDEVHKLQWTHRIDLGHGLVTPGRWPHNPRVFDALDKIDFRGKKVLDIGCWDGLFSFEAEKRGAAEVYSTDLVSQRELIDQPTFKLAQRILESKAKYFPWISVYDVEQLGVKDFDVVIYAGVYYHLKDPLRSFAKLRRVMKEGAEILVEGAVIDSPECYAKFYYDEPFLYDKTNWWIPTVPCLRQWVECNFIDPFGGHQLWDAGNGNLRCTMTARAARRTDPNYSCPDDELTGYDLNPYPPLMIRKSEGDHRNFPSRLFKKLRDTVTTR